MRDHQRGMLVFLSLAWVSQRKRQRLGRDRFLLLTAREACRAGWLDVAARCREIVLAGSPGHLIGQSPTVADALRDDDFQPFLRQLERFCSYEHAEHLLAGQESAPPLPPADSPVSAGEFALQLLAAPEWSADST
ncbi:MAG: hypothetical protein ACREJB_04235 [Planctomycetaceae bacterium]